MDSIKLRRSIRKYKDTPVSKELIEEILLAASLAPSAKNRQPWKFIVYTGSSKKEFLDEMEKGLLREKELAALLPDSAGGLPDAFHTLNVMKEAPVLVAVLNTNGASPFTDISPDDRITEICDSLSIGAAIENLLLKAAESGIGSLWIANTCFAYNELVSYIGTSAQLVGAVTLGYADEFPHPRPRKKFYDIVEYR